MITSSDLGAGLMFLMCGLFTLARLHLLGWESFVADNIVDKIWSQKSMDTGGICWPLAVECERILGTAFGL